MLQLLCNKLIVCCYNVTYTDFLIFITLVKVLIAHPGTQYSHQLVKQLEKQGLLYRFYTGIAIAEHSFFYRMLRFLPDALHKKISNRVIESVPNHKVKNALVIEWRALWELQKGKDSEAVFYERNKQFQEQIPDAAILASDVVIGFDTSSWILIERCKQLKRPFILDVSIAHPAEKAKVYTQIATQYPGWSFAIKHKSNALISLEQQELEQANAIVVASSFTKQTLIKQGISDQAISVNPYGVNASLFFPSIKAASTKINFVFVGLVDARKGVPLLLDVWKQINKDEATLTLIGPVSSSIKTMIETAHPDVEVKGKIPFAELNATLSRYDVLVFPSYFEGFGLVVPEAMACGLPVITTTATCGADIIDNGFNGLVIDVGSVTALFNAMQSIINRRYNLSEMSKRAREKAMQLSWDAYGERWKKILSQI